jgi:hypothetical protein
MVLILLIADPSHVGIQKQRSSSPQEISPKLAGATPATVLQPAEYAFTQRAQMRTLLFLLSSSSRTAASVPPSFSFLVVPILVGETSAQLGSFMTAYSFF